MAYEETQTDFTLDKVSFRVAGLWFRKKVLLAVLWLLIGWSTLAIANVMGTWHVAIAALMLIAWGVGQDIYKEGYFHPIVMLCFLSTCVVMVSMTWMSVYMDQQMPFFYSSQISVESSSVFLLAKQHMLLLSMIYLGYLLVRGTKARNEDQGELIPDTVDKLWYLFYGIGFMALVLYVVSTGALNAASLGNFFTTLGDRVALREGRGELRTLHFLGYVGAVLWFKKNISRSWTTRYIGLLGLVSPFLLYGSRTSILVTLIAAGFLDERMGRRLRPHTAIAVLASLVLFFATYLMIRGGRGFDLLRSIYLDASMGTAFVAAVQKGFFEVTSDFRPLGILQIVRSLLPNSVENYLGIPPTGNIALTNYLYPDASFSMSMGLFGEGGYILSPGWGVVFYLFIGVLLTWIFQVTKNRLPIVAAIVAGITFRMVKVDFLDTVAVALIFLLPIFSLYIFLYFYYRVKAKLREV